MMNKMNKQECRRINLNEEIEKLRHRLNQQKNITCQEALRISLELDRLILLAMEENGYGRIEQKTENRGQKEVALAQEP